MTEIEIDTDENGLAKCQCGANNLRWSGPADHNQREADHTLDEAKEIGGTFVWNYWDAEEFDEEIAGSSFDEVVEKAKQRAKRNGVRAYCGDCYGSMSPTMQTDELVDQGRDD